jgi:tetratricopeptide (TPR) repeat protein
MYYQAQSYDDAVVFLTQANKLQPDQYEVIVHLGNAYFDANKFEEAEKWYLRALGKKSDDISVRTDLGLTYMFREPADYERALKEFNKSLEIDPNHAQTLQNITVAYTKKGDSVNANAMLARFEKAAPGNTTAARLREDIAKIGKQ